MSLHDEIMNIECDTAKSIAAGSMEQAYRLGHRDARHAAAELSLRRACSACGEPCDEGRWYNVTKPGQWCSKRCANSALASDAVARGVDDQHEPTPRA